MKFNKIGLYSQEKDVSKMIGKFDLILLDEAEKEKLDQGKLEILDIFDNSNKRIGAASRKAYIKLGLTTWGVHIFVFNEKGQVYLQKRTMTKDTYPGFYAPSAAGHAGLGEDPSTSASRELREELGITDPIIYLGSVKCFQPVNVVNQFYFTYMVVTSKPLKADPEEIAEGGFYAWNDVKNNFDQSKFMPQFLKEINYFEKDIEDELKKVGIKLFG